MKLVVVGSVALDTVESPHGKQTEVLGGSAMFFSVSASFFTSVHLVAVVGEDFPQAHLDFLGTRPIDMKGLSRVKGKTFRWSGEYRAENLNEAITKDTQLNVFAGFKPDVPASFREAEMLFLANIDPDLQHEVLRQVQGAKFVACDTMNLWIQTKPDVLKALLKKVNLLMINDGEARLLSGERNLVRAAQAILSMGVPNVCIKRGEYGAILFQGREMFHVPAYPLEEVKDPTGAGDTFAGGFMGALSQAKDLSEASLRRAMVRGAVMASFVVEAFSVDRMKALAKAGRAGEDEIENRFRAFQRMTQF